MMNLTSRFVLVFKTLVCALALSAFAVPEALARPQFSAVTVDARTGQILFQDQVDGLRHPASLTKMMTLYVLFQDLKSGRINRNTKFRVSARAAAMPPSKLHLVPGSSITADEAIKALVTKSANDVAATIAENLGGSEANFANRMTRVAHSIGMSRSTFRNASGLPNPQQYTTARDMATLGLRLMRDFPQYYPYFRITEFQFHGHTIRTHNRLVQHYPGTDGIKTGYIADAGYNLVTSTKRGDRRLVGVVLGARSSATRGRFMMQMFDKLFNQAQAGNTIAALAGSSKGVIDPLAKKPRAEIAQTSDVASTELASASAEAASGSIDTNALEEDAQDEVTTGSGPKVLEANLDAPTKKASKLPFAVVSAADQPATIGAATWNIQIGSFTRKTQAEARIIKLRRNQLEALAGKEAFTDTVQNGNHIIYHARFSGFDQMTAKLACLKITKLGSTCTTIAPQG
jgi:D-alanyl-D-alanine carboxypeptidase